MSWLRLLAFVSVVAFALSGCEGQNKGKGGGGRWGGMNVTQSVTVEVTSPRREPFVVNGDYPGEFVSDGMAELSSEVAGRVKSVEVRLGDVVKKGDALAVVDPVSYRQRVLELQASVQLSKASAEEAKVQKANLEAELARKRPLLAQKLVTEREVENLEAQISAAEQRLQVARASMMQTDARLGAARDELADTRVKAPFDGTIAERYVDVGAHVSPGQPMFRVVDDQEVYLRLRVPEIESGLIKTGQPVEVRVDALGGGKIDGEVGRVAPAVDPQTRTLRVDVVGAKGSDWGSVKPGMYARARLVLGERADAVTIDNQAIRKDRDGSRFVWTIKDGKAAKRTITTGLRGQNRSEVTEGLEPSVDVVLRGVEKLREGSEVTLVNTDALGQGAPQKAGEEK